MNSSSMPGMIVVMVGEGKRVGEVGEESVS